MMLMKSNKKKSNVNDKFKNDKKLKREKKDTKQ
jgi:hypothetical protein